MSQSKLMIDQPTTLTDFVQKSVDQIKGFNARIDALLTIDEKTKSMWKEVYENALFDRQNAYRLYADIWNTMQGDPAAHTMNGNQAAKYLERMGRANDQLIHLSEMMTSVEESNSKIDEDELFDQINNEMKAKD